MGLDETSDSMQSDNLSRFRKRSEPPLAEKSGSERALSQAQERSEEKRRVEQRKKEAKKKVSLTLV